MYNKSIAEKKKYINVKKIRNSDNEIVGINKDTGEVLPEFLDDNKKFPIKKLNSIFLVESYKRLNNPKSYKVEQCGTYLEYKYYILNKRRKLNQANFCKVRLCPMCSWRRSLKIFGQVSKVMDHALEEKDYRFIFLTLTCRNVEGDKLSKTIDDLFKAYNLLTKRKAFKQSVNGWFRALEVTHNIKNDTYHPHFHVVLMVNKSYFKKPSIYITQQDWTSLWQDCLQSDYTPIVDVRAFKTSTKLQTSKSVSETAKYAVKDSDLIVRDDDGGVDEEMTDRTVGVLDESLANRRLTAFGGELRRIHKTLNLDDAVDGDLINTDNSEELRDDLEFVIERYSWNIGYSNYVKVKD